jgi:hypothetical protein
MQYSFLTQSPCPEDHRKLKMCHTGKKETHSLWPSEPAPPLTHTHQSNLIETVNTIKSLGKQEKMSSNLGIGKEYTALSACVCHDQKHQFRSIV